MEVCIVELSFSDCDYHIMSTVGIGSIFTNRNVSLRELIFGSRTLDTFSSPCPGNRYPI